MRRCFCRIQLVVLVLSGLLVSHGSTRHEDGWRWRLPDRHYGNLSFPQRTSVDRALSLHERGLTELRANRDDEAVTAFRAAATEWRRFGVEYMDAPEYAMAYAHFMQAHGQHLARNRHLAVQLYTEVLDYYPDTPSIAIAALYWRGRAHEENGDMARAVADWTRLVEDADAPGHPLTAVAREQLALDAWRRAQWEVAGRLWETILSEDTEVGHQVKLRAAWDLMALRAMQGRWGAVSVWLEAAYPDIRHRTSRAEHFLWECWRLFDNHWRRTYVDQVFEGGEQGVDANRFRRGAIEWFDALGTEFVEAGKAWEHIHQRFDYLRQLDPAMQQERALEVIRWLRGQKDDDTLAESRVRQLAGTLANAGLHDHARGLIDLIQDTTRRLWVAYEIEVRAANFRAAQLLLDRLEQEEEPEGVLRARRARAHLFHHSLQDYEAAIPLYIEIAEPPGTLWSLQDCYRRAGRMEDAQKTLSEIVSMFPQDAARAMFQKAVYYERDGLSREAIAHYRRILAHPEWRQTSESSQAHQALERLGIATGGGVVHEIN